jgi:hypothetical protein
MAVVCEIIGALRMEISKYLWAIGDEYCMTSECVKVSGVMLNKMNRSVDPCEDFYEYACGQWKQDTPMPYLMFQWNEIYRIGMDAWTTVRRRFEQGSFSNYAYYCRSPTQDYFSGR